jgi:tripartite-type tricarboxylate transporter receptor subunit TctC
MSGRAIFCAMAMLIAAADVSIAQPYPSKPIRLILPFPPGAPSDIVGRTVGQRLAEQLGENVVPDNRPGAGGNLAMGAVAKAAPDGYTLMVASPTIALSSSLYKSLPYDPIKDFAPVARLATIENVMLVHPSVPAKTLQELIEMAKAKPNSVSWGTLGTTSNGPLLIGLFKKYYGAGFYMIPYKSTIQALQGTVAGDVNVVAYAAGGAVNLVKAGKLRAIAYTGDKRHAALPDVPTFAEVGVKLGFRTWIGMFAPSATPRDIVQKLNAETVRIFSDPGFTQKFIDSQGIETSEVTRGSAEQFAQFIKADRQAYEEAVKAAGIEKK